MQPGFKSLKHLENHLAWEKKRVEQAAPQLVSLVKSAGVSLAKVGLEQHRARVCLVLDISGSMSTLYRKGLVQRFAERIEDDGTVVPLDPAQPSITALINCQGFP
jgi:hypothetical protein